MDATMCKTLADFRLIREFLLSNDFKVGHLDISEELWKIYKTERTFYVHSGNTTIGKIDDIGVVVEEKDG